MRLSHDSRRIVIAGASSLLGAELKALLEESQFADWDFRLVDEELGAGTLTEAGGEVAIIQTAGEDTFHHARLVFFAGSPAFTRANLDFALGSGADILDLSGETVNHGAVPWLGGSPYEHHRKSLDSHIHLIPAAAAEAIAKISLALSPLGLKRLCATAFQPVSGAGRAGVEELETQTSQLLSFQAVGKQLFDAQIAFNMLDRYGAESLHRLGDFTDRVRREVLACLGDRAPVPAIQVLHAPLFYGKVFSACAELPADSRCESLASACKSARFLLSPETDAPSNISVAGETALHLSLPQRDSGASGSWCIWGAADNIRLPAWNAVKLAELLVA